MSYLFVVLTSGHRILVLGFLFEYVVCCCLFVTFSIYLLSCVVHLILFPLSQLHAERQHDERRKNDRSAGVQRIHPGHGACVCVCFLAVNVVMGHLQKTPNVDLIVSLNHIDPESQRRQLQEQWAAVRKSFPTTPLIMFSGHRHVYALHSVMLFYLGLFHFSVAISSSTTPSRSRWSQDLIFARSAWSSSTCPAACATSIRYCTYRRIVCFFPACCSIVLQWWVDTSLTEFYNLSRTTAATFPTDAGAAVKAEIRRYWDAVWN